MRFQLGYSPIISAGPLGVATPDVAVWCAFGAPSASLPGHPDLQPSSRLCRRSLSKLARPPTAHALFWSRWRVAAEGMSPHALLRQLVVCARLRCN